jgi:hypothetical protein
MALQNNSILASTYPSYAATQVSSLTYVEALKVLSTVDNSNIFTGAREYINGSRSLVSFVNLTISSLGINNIIDITSGFVADLVNTLNSFFSGTSRLPDNTFTSLTVSDTFKSTTTVTVDEPTKKIEPDENSYVSPTLKYSRSISIEERDLR